MDSSDDYSTVRRWSNLWFACGTQCRCDKEGWCKFHLRDFMLCGCARNSGFVCVMCLCCYCWCLCGGVLLGVLLSVWMQWLLSIDMMDMLTDLWCACWLRMDRQSSIVLLSIIPRPCWIDCCCWRVNVVVHVHVPVHSGAWLLILMTMMVKHPCGGLL